MTETTTNNSISISRADYFLFSMIQLILLGWIQFDEKFNNAKANSNDLRSIFSFSLGLGTLACIWKTFFSKQRKRKIGTLTHDDLLQLARAFGYPVDVVDDGLCDGFSLMQAQAILASDEETFYRRLHLISFYKYNFKLLIEDVDKARSKKGINLTSRDQELLEIPAFLDGGFLYQKPEQYKPIFNQLITQINIETIYSYTQSATLIKNANRSLLLNKCHIFNVLELENYLDDLSKMLQHCPLSTPVVLASGNHVTSLRYRSDKHCWEYLDINDLQQNTYYQNLDTKGLVEHFMDSFNDTNGYTLFSIKVYSTISAEKINPHVEALDKKYPVRQEDVNRVNNSQLSLLHLSCMRNDLSSLKQIINLKANLNQADSEGKTPLQKACAYQHQEIVKLLLEHGADPNQAAPNGVTPLHIACAQQNQEIVTLVLKYGAEPNQADHDGMTPLKIACQWENLDIINDLKKYNANPDQADREDIARLQSACRNKSLDLKTPLTNSRNDLIAEISSCKNSKQQKNTKQFTMNLINEVGPELKDINKSPEIINVKKIGETIENNLEKLKEVNPTPILLKWVCNRILLNLWNAICTFVVDQSRSFRKKMGTSRFFNHYSPTKKIIANLNETQERITKLGHKELETCEELNKSQRLA